MVVNADVSISYELKYEKVPEFYVKFRADHIENFTDGFLRNVTRDEINNVAGKYSVEEIMGDNGPIFLQVRNNLQKRPTRWCRHRSTGRDGCTTSSGQRRTVY